MSKPIERPDTTYLDLSDRILLTKSAVEMVNEGLELFALEMESSIDFEWSDEHDEAMEEMASQAYESLIRTMTTSKGDRRALMAALILELKEARENE
tara:strand:- start:1604 stop:1894 length:291 start_codon:yes stop_codon:yes gene_type:complete